MLLYLNFGGSELILILMIAIFIIAAISIGNYGRNTAFGYGGSILLAIFANPLIAFIILYIVKKNYHRETI